MIHLIYMAAGQSRRFGANKLLSIRGDRPLYRHGLDALRRAIRDRADCHLLVVTCWEEIALWATEQGIDCIDCPDSHLGVSHTIRAGIRACEPLGDEDYLCFCVADQPQLRAESVAALLNAAAEKPLTAGLMAGDVPGNPTLFAASLVDELLALEGDRGGRAVMRRHPEHHIDVSCDIRELEDVDFSV
jgi:molybdenum cofactor cytidylyltransferase